MDVLPEWAANRRFVQQTLGRRRYGRAVLINLLPFGCLVQRRSSEHPERTAEKSAYVLEYSPSQKGLLGEARRILRYHVDMVSSQVPADGVSSSQARLQRLIQDKSAIVGVIGLGYVGLPLVRAFTAAGFRCLGFDVDQAKVDKLNAGESYIKHIDADGHRRAHS